MDDSTRQGIFERAEKVIERCDFYDYNMSEDEMFALVAAAVAEGMGLSVDPYDCFPPRPKREPVPVVPAASMGLPPRRAPRMVEWIKQRRAV